MKKFALLVFLLAVCLSYSSHAKVVCLANSEERIGTKGSASDDERCTDAGYTYTTCAGALVNPRPYNQNQYKICCPAGYKYTLEECGARPRSVDSCYGYYKCGEDANSQSADEHCRTEGFTSKLPTPQYGDGYVVNYTMPGCPVGSSLKTCSDDTGSYWKCVSGGF